MNMAVMCIRMVVYDVFIRVGQCCCQTVFIVAAFVSAFCYLPNKGNCVTQVIILCINWLLPVCYCNVLCM